MLLNCGVEEDSWESLDCKEIQPVHPKGDQSWVFIGRTDVEAETPMLSSPDAKSWLIWKDPDAGKDCRQEEKGMTEDEMVGWHHQLNGHGFGWTWWTWWWTGRPGVLLSMGLQRVGHDWATELNWTEHLYTHTRCRKPSADTYTLEMRKGDSFFLKDTDWERLRSWIQE